MLESKESQHFFDETEDSSRETMCALGCGCIFASVVVGQRKISDFRGLSQEIGLAPISTLVHEALATTQKKHSMPQQ